MRLVQYIVLCALLALNAAPAGATDLAYLLGLVTGAGGTAVNDLNWVQHAVEGRELPDAANQTYFSSGGQAVETTAIIATNNGYVLIARWFNDQGAWTLDGADILKVSAGTLLWFGEYDFLDSRAELLDKPFAIRRDMVTGDSQFFSNTAENGQFRVTQSITLLEEDVTVPGSSIPTGTDATNAARFAIQFTFGTGEAESLLSTMLPGRGETLYAEADLDLSNPGDGVGEYFAATSVPAWGDGSNLPAFVNNDLAALRELTVTTVTLPADSPACPPLGQGGNRVVVVPLN